MPLARYSSSGPPPQGVAIDQFSAAVAGADAVNAVDPSAAAASAILVLVQLIPCVLPL